MSALCKVMSVLQVEQATSRLSWGTLALGGEEFPRGWCRGTKASSCGCQFRSSVWVWLSSAWKKIGLCNWKGTLGRYLPLQDRISSEQVAQGFSRCILKQTFHVQLYCFTLIGGQKSLFIQLKLLLNLPSRTVWPSSKQKKFEKVLWMTSGFE